MFSTNNDSGYLEWHKKSKKISKFLFFFKKFIQVFFIQFSNHYNFETKARKPLKPIILQVGAIFGRWVF